MESVGVRELRQNASALLERVATGETIEITNHGHPVARLVPVPVPTHGQRTREQLIEAGLLRPGRGSVLDVTPIRVPPGTPTMSELLAADREDR